MKHLLSVFAALLAFSLACPAAVGPPERGEGIAAAFFRSAGGATKSTAQPSIHLLATYPEVKTKAASTDPLIYVYAQDGGGYVLVAGEDAARPVLGYDLSGSFPDETQTPPAMRDLLDFYMAVLYRARTLGWQPSADVRAQWDVPAKAVPASSPVVLTTAKWNQFSPYNDLCPKVNGQECPCGCVATAIAIIMRYHSWPAQGTGTLPGYDYGWDGVQYQYHLDGLALGHPYNWDSMSLEGNFTQAGRGEVARLIRDLGIMCKMDYDPAGSGASSISPIYLAQYFSYDKQMRYYDREEYGDTRWEELIRDEIDARRPVFYCGVSKDGGGHAFVLDGYNGRYFSINYGWGGYSNAFYTLTPIEGHASDVTEFTQWQDMVCRIMPDQGGTPYVKLSSGGFAFFGWDFRAAEFTAEGIYVYPHSYLSTGDGVTPLCYCLYDRDGNLKEVLSEPYGFDSNEGRQYLPAIRCKAPSAVASGDVIQLSRPDDRYGWTAIPDDRLQQIRFSERPLSEMISFGHTYGEPSQPDFSLPSTLFFRADKDLYWEIRRKDGTVLISSSSTVGMWGRADYGFNYRMSPRYNSTPQGSVDYSFWIPAGEYAFCYRNATEEMTLHVKL